MDMTLAHGLIDPKRHLTSCFVYVTFIDSTHMFLLTREIFNFKYYLVERYYTFGYDITLKIIIF